MIITKKWSHVFVEWIFKQKKGGVAKVITVFVFYTLPMWESQVISSRIYLERKSSFLISNQVRLARVSCLIVGGILYIKWLSDRERCFIKDLSFFSFSFGSQLFCTYEFFFQCSSCATVFAGCLTSMSYFGLTRYFWF